MKEQRDVLLIPCWRRPEFLWHCLDNLSQSERIEELHVLFRADTGHDRAIRTVIEEFAPKLPSYEIDVPVPCPYRRSKQSANLLGGFLLAAAQTRRYVFMVEEDVMVARDFLRWHYAVHAAQPRLFCSIATHNINRPVPANDDPEIYYLTSEDYCSIGVCFERSVLLQLVAPHVRRDYFADPSGYCELQFGANDKWGRYVEQDGLLRRIQASEGRERAIAYPFRPRAFHAGYIGYHRRGALHGPLQQRIRAVGQIIYNAEAMRQAARRPAFFNDSVPVPLDTPHWESLRQQGLPATLETAV